MWPSPRSDSRVNDSCPHLGVQFVSFVAGCRTPYDYFWDFADGTTSTDPQPAHTYVTAGTYRAVLYVNCPLAQEKSIVTVTVDESPPPVVTILPDRQKGPVPLTIGFESGVEGGVGPDP